MYYYVNQKDYPHVLYPTNVGTQLEDPTTTIADAGCGVCCASMLVTNLTGHTFSLAQALEFSMSVGANHSPGTDMGFFAPKIAEKFDLDLVVSDDAEQIRALLTQGWIAIANVGGDRPEDGWTGLFSHNGHFVTVVDYDTATHTVVVLDPSQVPGKYDEEGRKGKVEEQGYILHTSLDILLEDCASRKTEHYPVGSEFRAYLELAGLDDAENRVYLFTQKH